MTIDLPSIACVACAWKQWGTRKTGRARRRHACLPRARPFSLSPTTSKRVLRRLYQVFLTGIVLSEHQKWRFRTSFNISKFSKRVCPDTPLAARAFDFRVVSLWLTISRICNLCTAALSPQIPLLRFFRRGDGGCTRLDFPSKKLGQSGQPRPQGFSLKKWVGREKPFPAPPIF